MLQHEFIPRAYTPVADANNDPEVKLESSEDSKFQFTFEPLRPGLFRTTFTSPTHPIPPHPSANRPEKDFGSIEPTVEYTGRKKTINVGDFSATVEWDDCPIVTLRLAGQLKPIYRDLDLRSYAVDSTGIAHYTRYKRDTLHVGLGEKAAPMNLSNRNFILSATDAFGYGQ